MSKRTLRGYPEGEGKCFRALAYAARESLARHYLWKPPCRAGEIALLLFVEDPISFYRAYQEWTGQTPDSTRHALRLS